MGANIKNNHKSALGVGSVTINPGATAFVADWDKVKISHAIKTWLSLKVISVVSEDVQEGGAPIGDAGDDKTKSTAPTMPGMDAEAVAKQKIIDELREKHGIEKTLRTSLENLQKALTEARKSSK